MALFPALLAAVGVSVGASGRGLKVTTLIILLLTQLPSPHLIGDNACSSSFSEGGGVGGGMVMVG